MSAFSQQHLVELGFRGFENLRSLPRGCAHLPVGAGIYVVVADPSATHGFLDRSVGGRFKRQDGTVAIHALAEKWDDDIATLYIGRSQSIRRRVDEFARYGRGDPIGHRGGRYLWQLAEHDHLRIGWRLEADPVRAESDLLDDFVATFGHLPFANLVRGTRRAA